MKLRTAYSSRDVVLNLHKVLFVPELTKNLLSVPAMAVMGAEVRFDGDKCVVLKDGLEFVIGSMIDNKLYGVCKIPTCQLTNSPTLPYFRFPSGYDYRSET